MERFIVSVNPNIIDKGEPWLNGWRNQTCDYSKLKEIIKKGWAFSPGVLKENHDGKKHSIKDVDMAYVVAVDVDNGNLVNALSDPFVTENALFIYTTPSHTKEQDRFRIVFVSEQGIVDPASYSMIAEHLVQRCNGDKACKDASRLFYGNRKAQFFDIGKKLTSDLINEILTKNQRKTEQVQHTSKEDEIRELLSYIPTHFGQEGYNDWFKVVSAVGNEVDLETAIKLINEWSPDLNQGTRYKLQHRLTTVSMGTLKYYARMNGWSPSQHNGDAKLIPGWHRANERLGKFERLYENGVEQGTRLSYDKFDEHFRWYPGQLTVVTGIPSHGKSNWMSQVMVRLALMGGWKCGVFSPEDSEQEIHMYRLAEIIVGKPFLPYYNNRMSVEERNVALEIINEHFYYIHPKDENYTLAQILAATTDLIDKFKINFLLIDPWNTIEHQYGNENETTYTARVLNKLKYFARNNNIHICLVVHPRKVKKRENSDTYEVPTPYDISGSANWYNVPDNIHCVYRWFQEKELSNKTTVYVQKVKHKFIGNVGSVKFGYEPGCQRYHEITPTDEAKSKYSIINQFEREREEASF